MIKKNYLLYKTKKTKLLYRKIKNYVNEKTFCIGK